MKENTLDRAEYITWKGVQYIGRVEKHIVYVRG